MVYEGSGALCELFEHIMDEILKYKYTVSLDF